MLIKTSKFFIFLLLLAIILCFSFGCLSTAVTSPVSPVNLIVKAPRNIILIGWDGAQRNHLKESLSRGELPNLQKLSEEGNLVAIDIFRTTDTKAGWSQILTGYEPEITGVFSNGRYQPIPKGYTIFERLEAYFGSDKFFTAAVIGKKGHIDSDPPQTRLLKPGDKAEGQVITENGKQYDLIPGKPYFFTKEGMDMFINGLGENKNVGNKALSVLEQYQDMPFFLFIHFADVDTKGHGFGENSKEYNDALISSDLWTGKIIEKLKELGLYDQTLIYVTADHGFDEDQKSHNDAPYVFLGTNDSKVITNGQRADITPTILDRFGLDLINIIPSIDGHPLTKSYQPSTW
jgi:predicted AlkP superfamily pyrophosphatase or phosphodiesterase